ncbi:MAG: DMT family transporter [Rhodoferax sp.]|nr:DMT family transporter [Rhodoferax sp.]
MATSPVERASTAIHSVAGGVVLAMLGAVAFSGKAIIVKLAYRYGVDAITLIMLRMLFAFPFFLAIGWWTSRRTPTPDDHQATSLTRRDMLGIFWLGFSGYYLASFLDFLGLQFITAALERLILYLSPTMVLLLGFVIFRRRIGWHQALGMAISYCGVLLAFAHELTGAHNKDVVWGTVLVFLSATSYAIYLFYSGELVQRLGAMRLVGLATSVASVLCIAQFALLRPMGSVLALAPEVLWLSLLNATLCTVLPVMLVMVAVERIGSSLAAQAGMIGPMSTMLLGGLLLDEPLTAWLLAGTVLVIAGVFVCSRARLE